MDNILEIVWGLVIVIGSIWTFIREKHGQEQMELEIPNIVLNSAFNGVFFGILSLVLSGITWYFFGVEYAIGMAILVFIILDILSFLMFNLLTIIILLMTIGVVWYFFGDVINLDVIKSLIEENEVPKNNISN